jgi:hypothetical protein
VLLVLQSPAKKNEKIKNEKIIQKKRKKIQAELDAMGEWKWEQDYAGICAVPPANDNIDNRTSSVRIKIGIRDYIDVLS